MAKSPRASKNPWADAISHLHSADPALGSLMTRVGPCSIRPKVRKDRFATLVRAIIGQQISSKAAASIDARLRDLTSQPHTPEPLIALGETGLRSVGLSGVKARYVLNLAEAVRSGDVPLDLIHKWDDEAIITRLTTIKGVGVWTAEMFLIFALGRPDVFPVGDLGVRAGLRDHYGLPDLPKPQAAVSLGDIWRPYRSVASWYLWRSLDPQYKILANPASIDDPKASAMQ